MEDTDGFDKILTSVGDNGRYQRILVLGLYLFLSTIMPWIALVQIFVASAPDHWCHVEGKPGEMSVDNWKNLTLPWETIDGIQRHSKCLRYEFINVTTTQNASSSSTVIDCTDGWDYDDTWYDSTLSTTNDWVCDDSEKAANWLTIAEAGGAVGMIIFGLLSDILGRKNIVVFLSQLFAVMSLLRIFFPHGWLSYLIMFFSYLPFPSIFQVSFIWVCEQVNIQWRVYVNMLSFIMWTVGMCALPLLAWLTRSWIYLTLSTSIPCFCILAFWPFVKESPRWLASRGKTSETLSVLQSIADRNRMDSSGLNKTVSNYMSQRRNRVSENIQLMDIARSALVRKWLILIVLCFHSNVTIYYGLTYNVYNLGGNEFVNFFLLGLVEVPASIVAWVCCQTIGRRLSQALFFLLTFITILCPVFFENTEGVETVVCAILSKCLINGSFFNIYLLSLEILPTSHRGFTFGFMSLTTAILGISKPYIAYSSAYWTRLPYVIFASLALVGFVSALFLPESMDHSLPQHISDSEAYFGNQSFWSYKGRRPKDWKQSLTNVSFSPSKQQTK